MSEDGRSTAHGCAWIAPVLIGLPLIVVSVVGVRTLMPLHQAKESLEQLERALGTAASYTPSALGAISAERMEAFVELRTRLIGACEEYRPVQLGFDSVASLETQDEARPEDIPHVVRSLGGAAFEITPFLARFFELRNDALLSLSMGLEEYSYIYAVAYRKHLLSGRTRVEIFSGGQALSPAASEMLRGCLRRQLAAANLADVSTPWAAGLDVELQEMVNDPSRLVWQDELPETIAASVLPYRERLDSLFCPATAGLEMERGARRALWLALE